MTSIVYRTSDTAHLPIFSVESLRRLPTLHIGHYRSLKIAAGDERIWLGLCPLSDKPCIDHVTVERLVDGRWQTVLEECHG